MHIYNKIPMTCNPDRGVLSCIPPPPLGGGKIKLLGKEIKWGRREGEEKGEEGKGTRY